MSEERERSGGSQSRPEPALELEALEPLLEKLARRIVELEQELRSAQVSDGERSPWLSLLHAAVYLDWPRQRLYKLTAQGAIPHYKHEGRLLFNRDELEDWLRSFRQGAGS